MQEENWVKLAKSLHESNMCSAMSSDECAQFHISRPPIGSAQTDSQIMEIVHGNAETEDSISFVDRNSISNSRRGYSAAYLLFDADGKPRGA